MILARCVFGWWTLYICILTGSCPAEYAFASDLQIAAQGPSVSPDEALPDAPEAQSSLTEKRLPLAILKDQIPIWTSPVKVRTHDLIWLVPLGAATGIALAIDTTVMRDVSHDRTFNKDNVNVSNTLLGSEFAIPVGLYSVGVFKHDAHARETGILSGEALADSVVVVEVSKLIFRRERPLYNDAAGDFFAPNVGRSGSFPSSHSMLAWTMAGVVAGEYPAKWVQIAVYSIASGVSLTRVLGQEHFPSDVLVGATVGWLIGHYVFDKHQLRPLVHAR
jgi:hypothetical protein